MSDALCVHVAIGRNLAYNRTNRTMVSCACINQRPGGTQHLRSHHSRLTGLHITLSHPVAHRPQAARPAPSPVYLGGTPDSDPTPARHRMHLLLLQRSALSGTRDGRAPDGLQLLHISISHPPRTLNGYARSDP